MIADSQKAVIDFLASPTSHGGAPVQQIDTHLSHIFLAGARAYKIKRAVRYDFADFSTQALRRAACEKEVAINRRTAPGLYLGVAPLYAKNGVVDWRGEGAPVDWAVEMARFDTNDQFDALIARGKLDVAMIRELADVIADFHRSAAIIDDFRPGAGVPAVLEQITTALHDHEIGAARERDVARFAVLAFKEYEKHARVLELRRRHGWVRHCHGDLHLANICLLNGRPTPFDAIEFNDALANIDVLYDLAFTLMDLVHHKRGDLANILLNRYLSATRDYSGLRLLPLFLAMRAGVRAMVLSLPIQSERNRRVAGRYLDDALEPLVGGPAPRLLAVGGYSATGKSTLAGALAMRMNGRIGAILLRSDVMRKRLQGKSPETPLAPDLYGETMTAAVYRRMLRDAHRALCAGCSVVLDATFLDRRHREAAEATAQRAGVPFDGVLLTAPRDVLQERLAARLNGASDATASVLEQQLQRHADPRSWPGSKDGAWHVIDADRTPSETLKRALAHVDLD